MEEVNAITDKVILNQLKKINDDTKFSESRIMPRFLLFIVHETLLGRQLYIKEYSIAVSVLNKPINFDPRMDGVVRVHARRLRDALSHYYETVGINDLCIISIPKGRYVPIFQINHFLHIVPKTDSIPLSIMNADKKTNILFMPFKTFEPDIFKLIFADHVKLSLTTELATFAGLNVRVYHSRSIKNYVFDDGYTITGCVDFSLTHFRILFRLTELFSKNEVWCEEFEFKYGLQENYKEIKNIITRIQFCLENYGTSGAEENFRRAIQ